MNDTPSAGWTGRTSPPRAKIFISYRRRETAGYAGRLYDGLVEHFGASRVFMDVTMEPGVDFAQQIRYAVGSCGALIALIGEDWLTITDASGRRRIDDPADVHRLELEAALARGVRVIPALVQDAELPSPQELPEPLRPLVARQSVELSDERWDYDVSRLVDVLERVLSEEEVPEAGGPAARWRRRARRAWSRARYRVARRRGRAGFVAGALASLGVVAVLLAASGYFSSPVLEITSFGYTPPKPDSSLATCNVRVRSEYVITKAHFIVDGNPENSLDEQTHEPWQCGNVRNRNVWDTCEGHSRKFRLDDSRPHTLTVTLTDFHGNTITKTRQVETNCPQKTQ
jgi:hypothetical protein